MSAFCGIVWSSDGDQPHRIEGITQMSDTISLNLIGERLHAIQAEQRTLRGDNELLRKELGRVAGAIVTRDTLNEVLTVLVNRIANFEALIESRFDALAAQLSRLEPGAPG